MPQGMRSSLAMARQQQQQQGARDRLESSIIDVESVDEPDHVDEQAREQATVRESFQQEGNNHKKFGGGDELRDEPNNNDPNDGGGAVIVSGSLVWLVCLAILGVILGATGTVLGIVNMVNDDDGDDGVKFIQDTSDTNDETAKVSLIKVIEDRGYINCGTGDAASPGFLVENGNTAVGMEVDLCRMTASAIFNGQIVDPATGEDRYRIVRVPTVDRWKLLDQGDIDILFGATYNMERDVYEPSVGKGFAFTFPYFFDGLTMGGIPANVDCAENFDFNSTEVCEQTLVCVSEGTTHEQILDGLIPPENLIVLPSSQVGFPSRCNVQASESAYIGPEAVKANGYLGEYKLGTELLSQEPISIVVTEADPTFRDLIEWLIQALIFAEEESISKANSFKLGPTYVFGGNETNPHPTLEKVFENAVAFRGNYGEMYNFNLQSFLPRGGMNKLNTGTSPIMLAFPLGDVDVLGPEIERLSPTVAAIKARGFLNCGVNIRKGFADFDTVTRQWSGFDVELCQAIAAALFDGVPQVVYTDLPASERFKVLAQGRVDVLARLTTWTLSRDVKEPGTGVGLSFSYPYFQDGLKFGGVGEYTGCADRRDIISCQDLKVCVLSGTSFEKRVKELYTINYVETKFTFQEMIAALNDGSCNAIAGGFHDVARETIFERGYDNPGEYTVGENVFSKDPLALTTLQDDALWADFVKWVFFALIYAEENGITQETATLMPRIKLFGPLRTNAFFHAVNVVGNYGELYDRNFDSLVPRGGMHLLNAGIFGPMQRAPPGIAVE